MWGGLSRPTSDGPVFGYGLYAFGLKVVRPKPGHPDHWLRHCINTSYHNNSTSMLKIRVENWSVIHSKRSSLAFPLEMYSKFSPTKLDFARSYAGPVTDHYFEL